MNPYVRTLQDFSFDDYKDAFIGYHVILFLLISSLRCYNKLPGTISAFEGDKKR